MAPLSLACANEAFLRSVLLRLASVRLAPVSFARVSRARCSISICRPETRSRPPPRTAAGAVPSAEPMPKLRRRRDKGGATSSEFLRAHPVRIEFDALDFFALAHV